MAQVGRSGQFVRQLEGYTAFVPAPLPPAPAIQVDQEFQRLLSDADRALGRLDGVASILPNPDLFVAMYVRQEAVLSSQIEGTQSTLDDVLRFEADEEGKERPADLEEVVNYIAAMNHGLIRLRQDEFPLSLRLIREIHGVLLQGVRGSNRTPGEFRTSQNWIGGSTPSDALFVPPPVHEMHEALGNLEQFMHDEKSYPVLVHCGLVHAQFETIHPFLDGNGRMGRLLIAFLLCQRGVLIRPLLYLSLYLKRHRSEYYDRLQAVRTDGAWEPWLKFFLRGIAEVSEQATDTARKILQLRESHRAMFANNANALQVLDRLFEHPYVNVNMVKQWLSVSFATANNLVGEFEKRGLLTEFTGFARNRRFAYKPYVDLFHQNDATAAG